MVSDNSIQPVFCMNLVLDNNSNNLYTLPTKDTKQLHTLNWLGELKDWALSKDDINASRANT